MISLEDYLRNPCRTSSIPYWKCKCISVPPNMRIVHQDDYEACKCQGWNDTVYFRLLHPLTAIPAISCTGIAFCVVEINSIDSLVRHINNCYTDLQVSKEQMLGYTKTAAYCPNLWLFAKDASSGEILGSGIADYDEETRELILEWIQVLPVHRRKGVGQGIVNELLRRRPPNASFATVSGKADSISHPETLYRRCGFSGQDYWHILSK